MERLTEGFPNQESSPNGAIPSRRPGKEWRGFQIEVPSDLRPNDLTDPKAQYFREIDAITLLTAEQEVFLAQTIEAGKLAQHQLARLSKVPGNDSETSNLATKAHKGITARKTLTESNLRLVVSIARKYQGRGLALLDLIQEGNIGLTRAIDKFDWRLGYKLSTYATWWIRQAVTRAIADQARTIRIPVHTLEVINQLAITERGFIEEQGREPTEAELAEAAGMPLEKIRQLKIEAQLPISIFLPVGEDDDGFLGNFIQDPNPSPEEQVEKILLAEQVREVLKGLTPREQGVLKLRYGLDDDDPRTLEEVGREFGVTRERIRQIEEDTIKKLRYPSRSKKLRDYL